MTDIIEVDEILKLLTDINHLKEIESFNQKYGSLLDYMNDK